MSEQDQPIRPDPEGPHRPASVELNPAGARHESGLDHAHQSLADALKLVFRGVQLAMVVLLLVFAFSGLQTIKANESGIRLLFGRKTAADLPPGAQFAAPYPFGELVKIDKGNQQLVLDDSFWPKLPGEQQNMTIEKLSQMGKGSLKPGEDGSNITADENISHTRWLVNYTRANPGEYAENIYTEDEQAIVRAAVERGVVQAIATTNIDTLLKQSSADAGSVVSRAQTTAQAMLDRIHSGISIEQLTLKDKIPPLAVYGAFTSVQSSEQKSGEKRNAAEGMARNALNAMAGASYEPLVAQIDAYEQAISHSDQGAQKQVLDSIYALLDGQAVRVGDKTVQTPVAGQVTAILNEARQYRSTIVSQRRAELSAYQAKLVQFKSNPDVVVQRDWADAMGKFLSRDEVETFAVPPGTQHVEILVNRDVYKQREYARIRKQIEMQRKDDLRLLELQKEATKTRTDLQQMSLDPDMTKR